MADLSKQFDVVKTTSPNDPTDSDRIGPVHTYTAFTKNGEWAGRAQYMAPGFRKQGGKREQISITGRGSVEVPKYREDAPEVGDIGLDSGHWGSGLGNHLINYALSDAYRDSPSLRGDPGIVGSYLSPLSASWRYRLTGQAAEPSWGFDEYEGEQYTNHDHLAEWSWEREEQDKKHTSPKAAWEAGERAPEPEGTVEDRKREFREQ